MSTNKRIAAVSTATSVAADVRAHLVLVVGLLIGGLVLILSTGAEWLNAT